MSQKKSNFHDLVRETVSNFPQFERTVPGRQIFVSLNANELVMYNALCGLFRKHKELNEGHALAIAAAHFLNSVADDEEKNDESE
jgi:hypothetical protein